MVDVIAAVDSNTGAFGPLVQTRLRADMQTAINDGVTTAVAGMPGIAASVADIVTAKTTQGLLVTTGKNAITGWFHVDGYGAKGDGATDDTAAIQAAVDAAAAAYPGVGAPQRVHFSAKRYRVGAVNMVQTDGSVTGARSIHLKDGVELYGPGAHIQLKQNAYGVDNADGTSNAFFAIVRSVYSGLSNAGIVGITFDGNRSANPPSRGNNAGNILLEALNNVWIKDVTSIESNGNAIMVRGNAYGAVATDIRIEGCTAVGVNGIGIQAAQFDGCSITGNVVAGATDNGIDVYGEDQANHTTTSRGNNFKINNNRVHDCRTGIFLETVAHGLVSGNYLNQITAEAIHVNRINGLPEKINIVGNTVSVCDVGVAGTGTCNSINIRNNDIENFNTAGVYLGGGGTPGQSGDVAGFNIIDNTMNGNTTSTPLVLIGSGVGNFSKTIHLRTITNSRSRAYDTVNYAPNATNCTWAPALSPGD